jgi:hypothetical protein
MGQETGQEGRGGEELVYKGCVYLTKLQCIVAYTSKIATTTDENRCSLICKVYIL